MNWPSSQVAELAEHRNGWAARPASPEQSTHPAVPSPGGLVAPDRAAGPR
jgi:hypothetical protein